MIVKIICPKVLTVSKFTSFYKNFARPLTSYNYVF